MKVKSESEVVQSCPTRSYPMDCSPPGSSIHGIFQARALEWGAIAFSHIYATMCERDSLWEPAVMHRKLSWVLCDDLEQWSGSSGREAQKGGDICIYAAD